MGLDWSKAVVDAAPTADGGVVILIQPPEELGSTSSLARFRADGSLNRKFGDRGTAPIQDVGKPFTAGGVAVDSRGRIVVAGTEITLSSEHIITAQIPVIVRFSPTGHRDPSFGESGVVRSELGAPTAAEVAFFGPQSELEEPRTEISGIAIDSQDRILLSASYTAGHLPCGRDFGVVGRGPLVARLTQSGSLDPGFGNGGTWMERRNDRGTQGTPALSPGDGVVTLTKSACGGLSTLLGIGASGGLNSAFGPTGEVELRNLFEPKLVVTARDGRILLLNRTEEALVDKGRAVLTRLLPTGTPDPRFGKRGRMSISVPPRGQVVGVSPENDGSVLVAESLIKRRTLSGVPLGGRFSLAHVTTSGKIDRDFARGDRLVTGFGKYASAVAQEVILDSKGRALLVGTFENTAAIEEAGVAIARYRLGN